jgi:glycosyltransferase involved in cell wall biosynthesis
MRAGCNRANVVNIFYNKTDRDELVSMGIVSPEGCMFLPGVGIDINAYGQTPTESTTESVSPLVLMGCRLIHQKGVADFLEAAAMLSASGFEASFAIAGSPDEGNPDSIPTSQIAEWKAKYPVEFLGHVNDMPGLLARTSIAVLPTRYREGMPRFLLEASAAGVPAVATDTQGCREVVVDGQTGLLVKPGDVEALASAIKRVLESRETHARMSVAARSRAVSTFSTEHVTTAYEELYQSLLNAA